MTGKEWAAVLVAVVSVVVVAFEAPALPGGAGATQQVLLGIAAVLTATAGLVAALMK